MVTSKRPEHVQSFGDVKEFLREQVAVKKSDSKAFDKLLSDFIAISKIDVSAARFKDIPAMIKKNATLDTILSQPALSPTPAE